MEALHEGELKGGEGLDLIRGSGGRVEEELRGAVVKHQKVAGGNHRGRCWWYPVKVRRKTRRRVRRVHRVGQVVEVGLQFETVDVVGPDRLEDKIGVECLHGRGDEGLKVVDLLVVDEYEAGVSGGCMLSVRHVRLRWDRGEHKEVECNGDGG